MFGRGKEEEPEQKPPSTKATKKGKWMHMAVVSISMIFTKCVVQCRFLSMLPKVYFHKRTERQVHSSHFTISCYGVWCVSVAVIVYLYKMFMYIRCRVDTPLFQEIKNTHIDIRKWHMVIWQWTWKINFKSLLSCNAKIGLNVLMIAAQPHKKKTTKGSGQKRTYPYLRPHLNWKLFDSNQTLNYTWSGEIWQHVFSAKNLAANFKPKTHWIVLHDAISHQIDSPSTLNGPWWVIQH